MKTFFWPETSWANSDKQTLRDAKVVAYSTLSFTKKQNNINLAEKDLLWLQYYFATWHRPQSRDVSTLSIFSGRRFSDHYAGLGCTCGTKMVLKLFKRDCSNKYQDFLKIPHQYTDNHCNQRVTQSHSTSSYVFNSTVAITEIDTNGKRISATCVQRKSMNKILNQSLNLCYICKILVFLKKVGHLI